MPTLTELEVALQAVVERLAAHDERLTALETDLSDMRGSLKRLEASLSLVQATGQQHSKQLGEAVALMRGLSMAVSTLTRR